MMTAAVARRAQALAPGRDVRDRHGRGRSGDKREGGDVALVLGDGTIEGFVGGVCAQNSVRVYALKAMETEEALLLRIVPEGSIGEDPATGEEISIEEGAVTAHNPCLSGGAIEIFLEPVLPAPRVLVVGDSPIGAAVIALGADLGLDLVAVDGETRIRRRAISALVVAAHGRDELHRLRRGLEVGVPYVGLVASPKRGAAVIADLRADGVSDEHLALIDVPAGLDIGARTPAEVALSILATIVAPAVERAPPCPSAQSPGRADSHRRRSRSTRSAG